MSAETVPSQPFPLLEFPNEILLRVASHLQASDISSLMLTNRHSAGLFKFSLLQAASFYRPYRRSDARPGLAVFKWAVCHDRCALARELLDFKGSKINVNNSLTVTEKANPLTFAPSPEMAQLLLDRGASSALAWPESSPLFGEEVRHNVELTKFWLEKGMDTNVVDGEEQRTILHEYASDLNHDAVFDSERIIEIVEELLRHGADVHRGDCDGNTPLHLMAETSVHSLRFHVPQLYTNKRRTAMGTPSLCKIRKVVDLRNPLDTLLGSRGVACVKLLLRYGADPRRENREGKTFLGLCEAAFSEIRTERTVEAAFQELVEEVERSKDPRETAGMSAPL